MKKYIALASTVLVAASLSACALFGQPGGNVDPAVVKTVAIGITALGGTQQLYIDNCITNKTLGDLCTQSLANAKKGSHTARVAADDTVKTLEAGGDVATLVVQLGIDVADFTALWNSLSKQDAILHHRTKFDPLVWIQVGEAAIQVVMQVWQEIQGLGNNVDFSAVDKALVTVDHNDDVIQKA